MGLVKAIEQYLNIPVSKGGFFIQDRVP